MPFDGICFVIEANRKEEQEQEQEQVLFFEYFITFNQLYLHLKSF